MTLNSFCNKKKGSAQAAAKVQSKEPVWFQNRDQWGVFPQKLFITMSSN